MKTDKKKLIEAFLAIDFIIRYVMFDFCFAWNVKPQVFS